MPTDNPQGHPNANAPITGSPQHEPAGTLLERVRQALVARGEASPRLDPLGVWCESFAWSSARIGREIYALTQPLMRRCPTWSVDALPADVWNHEWLLAQHATDMLAMRLIAHELRDESGAAPLTTYREMGLDPTDEHGWLVPVVELAEHLDSVLREALQMTRRVPLVVALSTPVRDDQLSQLQLPFLTGDGNS